jgi:hypothetical protein
LQKSQSSETETGGRGKKSTAVETTTNPEIEQINEKIQSLLNAEYKIII